MKRFRFIFFNLFFLIVNGSTQADESDIVEMVKNSPCVDDLTIEEALKNKIRMRSQRDLGWQIIKQDNQYDVERAILMNKSMQLRFRWHIDADGTITPVSKRAQSLCSE